MVLLGLGEAAVGVGEGGFGGVLEVRECLFGGEHGGFGGVDIALGRSREHVAERIRGPGELSTGVGVVGSVGFGNAGEVQLGRLEPLLRRLEIWRGVLALQGGQRLLRLD